MGSEDKRIMYIGKDMAIWTQLQSKFQEYFPNQTFSFEQRYGKGKEIYGDLFHDIVKCPPSIIYMDFSVDPIDCLYLAKLVIRENSLKNLPIVGLLDYLTEEEHILKSVFTGIQFCHIKSAEFYAMIFGPMYIAYPKETQQAEFATAKVDEEIHLHEIYRLSYVSKDYVQLEGNTGFEEGGFIQLDQNVFDEKELPSQVFKVSELSETNLYYDYYFGLKAEFVYKGNGSERLKENAEDEVGFTSEQMQDLQDIRGDIKRRIDDFVEKNAEEDHSKSTKIFVIDTDLAIYGQSDVRLEKLPYSFRTQSYLRNHEVEIKRNMPHIICYQMDDIEAYKEKRDAHAIEVEEAKKAGKEAPEFKEQQYFNDFSELQRVIEAIKKIDGYQPFIICFNNNRHTSAGIQEELDYKKIITLKNTIELNLIVDLAKKFDSTLKAVEQKKLEDELGQLQKQNYNKYARYKPSDLKEKKVYFSKSDKRSWAFYQHKVLLREINELEVYIQSDSALPPKTPLRIKEPFDCFITIVPMDESNKWAKEKGVFRGLIHVIGEEEKKELRQYINSFFFKDKDEAKAKELEEFKKKNEEALKKKEEATQEGQEGDEGSADGEEVKKASNE